MGKERGERTFIRIIQALFINNGGRRVPQAFPSLSVGKIIVTYLFLLVRFQKIHSMRFHAEWDLHFLNHQHDKLLIALDFKSR